MLSKAIAKLETSSFYVRIPPRHGSDVFPRSKLVHIIFDVVELSVRSQDFTKSDIK